MGKSLRAFALMVVMALGCGEVETAPCTPGLTAGCNAGEICALAGLAPTCVAPVILRGTVKDTLGVAVTGARVTALDSQQIAVGVATSNELGIWEMEFLFDRDEAGTPLLGGSVTLRVDAAGFQSFPVAPRVGAVVALEGAVLSESGELWSMASEATDVELVQLAGDSSGFVRIEGRVEFEEPSGVLVAAVVGGSGISTAWSGPDGSFTLFNVPADAEGEIVGYRGGARFSAVVLEDAISGSAEALLTGSKAGVGSVAGDMMMTNVPTGSKTSVALVPAALFDAQTGRAEVPFGLTVSGVSRYFRMGGVAPGEWVVIPSLENDGLTVPPSATGGAGDYPTIVVEESSGETTVLHKAIEVTQALSLHSPGVHGLELVESMPMELSWARDGLAKGYVVFVTDSFGNVVEQIGDLIAEESAVGNKVTTVWSPDKLRAGMVYQVQVRSWQGDYWNRTFIRQTESMRGVFLYRPNLAD